MKKFLITAVFALLPLMSWSQAQIDTKKIKISDFTQKITKVVLTGNGFYDACLKSEVKARWMVSPFEFCTLEEFESLKSSDNYYFLMTTVGQFKTEREPGLTFLTLLKGGKNSEKGIDEMLEIVSIPLASVEDPSGREIVFLPVFLDIIQSYTLDCMDKDINSYLGLPNYSMNITKAGKMRLVFSEGDLSTEVTPAVRKACFNQDVLVLAEEDADEYVTPSVSNTLVSYVVAPSSADLGSYCYKMLIDPKTSKLYYFRKHRITRKVVPGFLEEDIKRITATRKK